VMPKPIVPPKRMRPKRSFSSPSMNMDALLAKEMTGDRNMEEKSVTAMTVRKLFRQGYIARLATTAKREMVMSRRCRFVLSAVLVQIGTVTTVIKGEMPVSSPICAPLKLRSWK